MRSIGNDIISIHTINPGRTKQQRFYSKFLSLPETQIYNDPAFEALPFEHFAWLLWSVKESAYKFLKRTMPELVFSPKQILVQQVTPPVGNSNVQFKERVYETQSFNNGACYCGVASFQWHVFYFRSTISGQFIHTVVNNENYFEDVCWGVKCIEHEAHENQSRELIDFVLKRLGKILPEENLTIEKHPAGYPLLLNGKKVITMPLSFTHHGHFIAYCFLPGKF